MLTPKQEVFTQGVVAGLSLSKAYEQAYDTSKMKQETVYSKASILWKQDKIRARYVEIIQQSSFLTVWTRERAFEERMWLLERTKETIEEEGQVRQSTGSVMNQTLDAMENLSFNDPKLKNVKENLEIEKLQSQIGGNEQQDDKIAEYINMVKGVMRDGD